MYEQVELWNLNEAYFRFIGAIKKAIFFVCFMCRGHNMHVLCWDPITCDIF